MPARSKIFLVAGGVEVANFAAEVIAQRRLWLARGLAPDEIACYWARPGAAELRADRRQYRRLAAELRDCYPASAAVLRAHLQQQATRSLPYLYLYIASPAYNNVDSSGQIGLALDTDSDPNSGGNSDAWGNAITFDFTNVDGATSAQPLLPDYLIRGNVSREGGWTELRTWSGNWNTGAGVNWGSITSGDIGPHIAYSYGNGIELAIPLADIGNPDPAHVKLQFFATQGGGTKGV